MSENSFYPILMEEKRYKDDLEKIKDFHQIQANYFKHLTTLSLGSILIAVAFLEKIFTSPSWPIVFFMSVFFFTMCIIGSLWAMASIGRVIEFLTILRRKGPHQDAPELETKINKEQGRIRRYDPMLRYSFLAGIVFFLIFAAINFFDY